MQMTYKYLLANEFIIRYQLDSEFRLNCPAGDVPYHLLSSGQKKRVDLSVFLSLYQLYQVTSVHFNSFVFFDEVFDSLDDTGKESMKMWLDSFSKIKNKQIFVITHDKTLYTTSRNKISVKNTKKEGTVYEIIQ